MKPKGNSEHKLATAQRHCESGDFEAAYKLYAEVRDANPGHDDARSGLDYVRLALKTYSTSPMRWQIVSRLMFHEYQKGNFKAAVDTGRVYVVDEPENYGFWEILGAASSAAREAEFAVSCFERAVRLSPQSAQAHSNLGVAYKSVGQLESSESAYRTAISLDGNQAEPLNNLGNLLIEMGRAEEAIGFLKMALQLQPNYGDAHTNLGIALHKVGELEGALQSYRTALQINSDDANLHNNLGVTLQMLGAFEEAVRAYALASQLDPENLEAGENLAGVLSIHRPAQNVQSQFIQADRDVRVAHEQSGRSPSTVKTATVSYIKKLLECFPADKKEFRTSLSQIYRRSGRDLNCDRHMSVFDTHGVIPEFCFGCYKLQIEPKNVIDLVKLFLFFDEIDLKKIRKCFVELRPEIPGFYKGLIYCDSVDDADEIASRLRPRLRKQVGDYLNLDLKRGCSEYSLRYPEYANINRSGPQLMQYGDGWKDVEVMHDKTYRTSEPRQILPSLKGVSLQDATVIRKWLDYAKGLDDPSCEDFRINNILYPDVYEIGRLRRLAFNAPRDQPESSTS